MVSPYLQIMDTLLILAIVSVAVSEPLYDGLFVIVSALDMQMMQSLVTLSRVSSLVSLQPRQSFSSLETVEYDSYKLNVAVTCVGSCG